MTEKLGLLVCSRLAEDVRLTLVAGDYPDIVLSAFSGHCDLLDFDWSDLQTRIARHADVERWFLVAGDCLKRCGDLPVELSGKIAPIEHGLGDSLCADKTARQGSDSAVSVCSLPAAPLSGSCDSLALALERHILRWRLEVQKACNSDLRAETEQAERQLVRELQERRQVEQTLRENELRLQDIVNNIADWVWEVDVQGVCTYSSPHVAQLFGYLPEEILGRDVFPVLHPETTEECRAVFFARADEGEAIKDLVSWGRHKDGHKVWILTNGLPLFDETGECRGYRGVDKDITALKTAEEELSASQMIYERHSREYQMILDGIPDNLIVLDPHFHVLWANQAALRCGGHTLEEALGRRCYKLWHNRLEPCENCTMALSLESGVVEEALVHHGGVIWGNKAFPIKNEDDEVIRVIELGSDITEKLRLREEAQRAGRLASLGELAAGVAHEINNPNALILLNAPILAEAFSDVEPILEDYFEENGDFPVGRLGYQRMRDELPRLLDGINGSARRIKRIVEDLKDFVRQDNDTFDEQIDLNAVVQAAVRLVGNVIKKSTHRFSAEYTSGLPPLHGHAQGIEQVVVNLIVNACQALPAPDCSIVVTTGCDAGRGEVFCEVRDEGSGIAPENLPFLTDPFFTTRREEGGTGLGLSVSARIVKEHDGSLVFDSQPGSGTIVTLAFPVKEERTS